MQAINRIMIVMLTIVKRTTLKNQIPRGRKPRSFPMCFHNGYYGYVHLTNMVSSFRR